jgi:hypothetical protein
MWIGSERGMRRELKKLAVWGLVCGAFFLVLLAGLKDSGLGLITIFSLGFVVFLASAIRTKIRRFPYRRLYRLNKAARRTLVHPEENESSLAKLLSKKNKSPEDLLLIGEIYSDLGHTLEAEKYAQDAVTTLEQQGYLKRTDRPARNRWETAVYAMAMLLALHGKFSEAAAYLQKQLPANQMRNFRAAWYYFLGHDEENAKAALMELLPPNHMPEYPQFMTLYMAYRLLNDTTAYEYLMQHSDIVEQMEWEAYRFRKQPFGVRTREIADDLLNLLELDDLESEAESC